MDGSITESTIIMESIYYYGINLLLRNKSIIAESIYYYGINLLRNKYIGNLPHMSLGR